MPQICFLAPKNLLFEKSYLVFLCLFRESFMANFSRVKFVEIFHAHSHGQLLVRNISRVIFVLTKGFPGFVTGVKVSWEENTVVGNRFVTLTALGTNWLASPLYASYESFIKNLN